MATLRMLKKNLSRPALSLGALLSSASWLSAILPQPLSIQTDLTYSSEYVFRGVRVAQDSFQPNIEASTGGFYTGIWANLPTDAVDSEINYYGGYGFAIPAIEEVAWDLGLTVYHYPDTGSDRTHEIYFGGSLQLPGYPAWGASLYYFHDFDIESHVGEGKLTYTCSLEGLGLPAALDFELYGGVQGGGTSSVDSYHYYGGSVALPYALTDQSTVTVALRYGTAEKFSFGPGQRGKNLFWSIGYTTSL